MSAFYREKVLSVQHWTDTLFSFRATRDSGFRFQNGQFAMIGLEVDGRPLLRAYSMASANHEEELEFFSIKVQDGPLTSKLQKIREGDTNPGRPQGDRHADHRQPDSRQAADAAVDRHRPRAVRQPDQGPRGL
ncbi:ferredoxin-NADP reductase [Bradyrhizobium sp. USDA 4516]